ncbi:MAG: MerR family transcriptional regulator [Bacteroidetes bacterium 4572_77]|nr:MAG: MerR family transcriptional regulator [Bacteroidetes bacterium 4572_77]
MAINHHPDKLYYSIGEVAEMFQVNTSLIRFWEKEFTVIRPKKNKKGNRLFSPKDVDNFHLIFHLVKEKGYTLKGAKEILIKENKKIKADKELELVKTLKEVRGFLVQLRDNI